MVKTPPEIAWIDHDLTSRCAAPLARAIARCIPAAVPPNVITWSGFVVRCAAAALLAATSASLLIVCGLIVFAELCDAVDGLHARNTGRCTRYGRLLDLTADVLSVSVLHACVLIHFDLLQPLLVLALVIRPVAAATLLGRALVTGELRLPALGAASESLLLCAALVAADLLATFPRLASAAPREAPIAAWLSAALPIQIFILVTAAFGLLYIAHALYTVAAAERNSSTQDDGGSLGQ
jgi:phosphatidylglycerophosphate synthase